MVMVPKYSGAPRGHPSDIRAEERRNALPSVTIPSRIADARREPAMSLGVEAFFGDPYGGNVLMRRVAVFAQRRSVR
jgi:hypothetical protein